MLVLKGGQLDGKLVTPVVHRAVLAKVAHAPMLWCDLLEALDMTPLLCAGSGRVIFAISGYLCRRFRCVCVCGSAAIGKPALYLQAAELCKRLSAAVLRLSLWLYQLLFPD